MKRASVAILFLLAMIGCGGSSKKTTVPSGVTNRAFVSNAHSGLIEIVDATKDQASFSTITVGSQPGMMAVSPQREITAVFDAGIDAVTVITNSTEAVAGSISLPGAAESMVLKDATVGFAAIRTASVNGVALPGAVVKLDTSAFTAIDCSASSRTYCVSVPAARYVVLSPDASKLLVFSEGSDSVRIIDTTKFSDTSAHGLIPGFNRPVSAVFSADGSKAYVLNCGTECGGTSAASVQVLTFASTLSQSTAGTPVSAAAATVGLLSGNTLFVAGTPDGVLGAAAGRLSAFDISSGTPVPNNTVGTVPIGDGYHNRMVLASNNKLFIGARDCTNNPGSPTPTGCLTIFDTSTNKAVISNAKESTTGGRFVTGIAAVPNRNVVYVVSDGKLRVFDTTTSAEASNQINIVGQASDVKMID